MRTRFAGKHSSAWRDVRLTWSTGTTLGTFLILASSAACTATLPVRTLPARQTRWTMSVGGPVAPDHVVTKVIPYLTVGAMHGLSDRTTVSGSVHVLSAALGFAGAKSLLYTGTTLTTQFSGDHRLLVSPSVGVQRDLRKRLTMQLEGHWMAANINTQRGLLEGESGINGHGGFALLLGTQVRR